MSYVSLTSRRSVRPTALLPGGYRPQSISAPSPLTPELLKTLGLVEPSEESREPIGASARTTASIVGTKRRFLAPTHRPAIPIFTPPPERLIPVGTGRVHPPPTALSFPRPYSLTLPIPPSHRWRRRGEKLLRRGNLLAKRIGGALGEAMRSAIVIARVGSALLTAPTPIRTWRAAPRSTFRLDPWVALLAAGGLVFLCSALAYEHERLQESQAARATLLADAQRERIRLTLESLHWEHAFQALQAHETRQLRTRHLAALNSIPSLDPSSGGTITSPFGWRTFPIPEFHAGIDLAEPAGHSVLAGANGVVTSTGWAGGFGLKVELDHGNGYTTWYAHLSHIDVHPGDTVHRGEQIAEVGSTGFATGPHLHYEILYHGTPIDPLPYLTGKGGSVP